MDTVHIFDTTLRDGEQSPGFSMTRDEKVALARKLEALGVDVIEAGFPVASAGELDAVRAVAACVRTTRVAALARARREDVEAALTALGPAARPRLHVFLATSDLHLQAKLRMTRREALEAISRWVRHGKERCAEVEFSAEDASRSDIRFLLEAMETAAEAGATILNLPDTVGFSTPEEYGAMFHRVRNHLGRAENIILSAHCHNDLGLAVANSLAAIRAGARQIECTINGIGERAGNASLEEVAVALAVRQNFFGVKTNIRLEGIYSASRTLCEITGVSVPPNKAVVGANAFAHEAGIHQDGILKNPLTYEIIRPEAVGVPTRRLVVGKHSGRNALRTRFAELGYNLSEQEVRDCYRAAMDLADSNREITDRDLLTLIHQARRQNHSVAAQENAVPADAAAVCGEAQ